MKSNTIFENKEAIEECLRHFKILVDYPAAEGNSVQSSLRNIFEESSMLLNEVIDGKPVSVDAIPDSSGETNSDHSCGDSTCGSASTSVDSEDSFDHGKNTSDINSIGGLVDITSLMCSLNPQSRRICLITLSPFWAILVLILNSKLESNRRNAVFESLQVLLGEGRIVDAAHTTVKLLQKLSKDDSSVLRAMTFMKNFMASPVMFATKLLLSLMSDLSSRLQDDSDKNVATVNELVRSLGIVGIRLLRTLLIAIPASAMCLDEANQRSPLAAVCGAGFYHLPSRWAHIEQALSTLSLHLVELLCTHCCSALMLADRQGLFPLHIACCRGASAAAAFIMHHFPYTVPLKDTKRHYFPLQHAMLNSGKHKEEVLVRLAAIYPAALESKNPFNSMMYASSNCSKFVYSEFQRNVSSKTGTSVPSSTATTPVSIAQPKKTAAKSSRKSAPTKADGQEESAVAADSSIICDALLLLHSVAVDVTASRGKRTLENEAMPASKLQRAL